MDAEIFKALGDKNRLEIVRVLASGERCVCDISAALGESDALVSHHLKRLRAAGLVRTRRRGLWLHCSLEPGAMERIAEQLRMLGVQAAESGGAACCGTGGAPEPRAAGSEHQAASPPGTSPAAGALAKED